MVADMYLGQLLGGGGVLFIQMQTQVAGNRWEGTAVAKPYFRVHNMCGESNGG